MADITPTVILSRVLRSIGLNHGQGTRHMHDIRQDFKVEGVYYKGERIGTIGYALHPAAEAVMAARADDIEYLTRQAGSPFLVSVRYFGGRTPTVGISNMTRHARVREVVAPAADVDHEPGGLSEEV